MKKTLTLLVLFSFLIGCSLNEKNFPSEDKPWEGWAGAPDKPGKQPFDYFYSKTIARASQKSIEKQSLFMMRDTCTDACFTTAKSELISKIVKALNGCEPDCDTKQEKLIKESQLIQEIKLKECKPIANESPEAPENKWRECECIVYTRFPGGLNALSSQVKDR
ncbi:MAG: hypothetical protein IPL26_15290 [Leptospiraceae bacterium]|nr:hypothetical protein [Leptospiraceae bacterium]